MSNRPSSGSGGHATSTKNVVVSWEEARLRQTLPRLIGRCMSYSAATCFDEALVAAVRRFYGIEVDVATAESDILEDDFERVRFFPWFLWDFAWHEPSGAADGNNTVGERFLADGELSEFERSLVRALARSSVAFVRVTERAPERERVVLSDLLAGDELLVRDGNLASSLSVGQIALVRLVRLDYVVPPEPGLERSLRYAMLDAIYVVLPEETRPVIELELEQLVGGLGHTEGLRVMKEQAPELLDFAQHVLHELTEPPTLRNADSEVIVLCRTLASHASFNLTTSTLALEGPFASALDGATAGSACPRLAPEIGAPWVWLEEGRVVGWIRNLPHGWVIEASSRERFARVLEALEALGASVPKLRSEEDLSRAVAQWLAVGECDAWLTDPEVDRAFRDHLAECLNQWPDRPHPALKHRTPREVHGEPGGDAVVARLVQRVRKVAGEAAGAKLATLLA